MSTRRHDSMLLVWPLITAVLDYVVLAGAILTAYLLRFHDSFARVVPIPHDVPPLGYYAASAMVGAAFCVVYMAVTGAYRVRFRVSMAHEVSAAAGRYAVAWALLIAGLFFYRDFSYSRVVALLALAGGVLALGLDRALLGALRQTVFPANPLRRALVVGPLAEAVARRLEQAPTSGLSIQGILSGEEPDAILAAVRERVPDTVVLAYPFGSFQRARSLIVTLGGQRLLFLLAPDQEGFAFGRLSTLTIAGLPLLQLREDPLAGWNGVIKRSFDIIVSALLLLVFTPLLLLLALLVKLSSPGPVIYRQTRVGLDSRPFTILKFRSMRVDAEKKTGPVWAKPGDDRTTPIGGVLRRWSLDELPQLINVLRGDMSLVGPRPERPEFVEQFQRQVPQYVDRHRVRAGMTGWAQVHGLRGQAPIEQRTLYDVYYVENWTLGLDLRILARTLVAVVAGRDAY